MRTSVSVALVVVLLVGPAFAQQQGAMGGLSGTWELDATRSDTLSRAGQPVADAAVTLYIDVHPPSVVVRRVVTRGRGQVVRSLTYTTDGTENKNMNPHGIEVRSRSRWDQGKLVTTGTETVQAPVGGMVDAAVSEIWTLSPDGGTLSIESTFTVPIVGENRHKEVYIRKR